jgi:single-stranded DNA-specific DHH superfamily exonuclease
LCPTYQADAAVNFRELSEECIQQIFSLGPFGFGNQTPTFYTAAVEIAARPKELREGKHFSIALRHNGRTLFAKAWNFGNRQHLLAAGTKLDVLFQIEDDPFSRKRGYASWCISLKDVRLAAEVS